MKIVCLLENTSGRADMKTEHGLSLYIETASHRILFDMGQTDAFARNAAKLKVDLATVDVAVLSHGHYDHGGGLSTFLSLNKKAPVYLHKDAFLPYYNGTEKYIGLDTGLENSGRLRFTQGQTAISNALTLFEGETVAPDSRTALSGLTQRKANGFIPDDFRHEQYLLIKENGRRVLLSGCSHRGVQQIAAHFTPDVLIGGFHFSKRALNEALAADARALNALPTHYYTCHCTGEAQYGFMKEHMKHLSYLACGETVIL